MMSGNGSGSLPRGQAAVAPERDRGSRCMRCCGHAGAAGQARGPTRHPAMLPDAAPTMLSARSPPPPAAAGRTAPGHARFVPVARSVFEFPAKSAYKLPMEQALTGGRVPCGACRATESGTNAMTMLDRIGDILRAAKVALAGAPDGGASDIRSPDGLTTGDDAVVTISRVAGSPGRRVAGSPGRRVAGSPGRRVAGSPGRRVAGSPGRRVAGSPGRPTCVRASA